MRFNFKKIASVLASTIMLSSTIGFAVAASYPAPFVSGGTENGAIVVGTNAALSDWTAAIDVQKNLQGLTTTSSSGGSGTSVSGGDSVNLATSSQFLFYSSSIKDAKGTITKSEMTNVLADGTIIDDAGTSYTYSQSIKLGAKNITYSTSGNDFTDPALYLDLGINENAPIYNISITLNKNINITHGDIQGNDISILGQKYTIGSTSTTATAGSEVLYLFGSGESVTLNEGEETTITIDGTEHTVSVSGIDSAGIVSVSIDGSTIREISEGSSSKVGGLEVFAKTTFYSAKESSNNYATLNIGSGKLKLLQAQTVYEGSDETAIQHTKVGLGIDSSRQLSSIDIAVASQSATKDWIKQGESSTDPIFDGVKISFAAATPALDSEAREHVKVDTDNSRNSRITLTTALATEEATFTYAHDGATSDSSVKPLLADTANYTIHVVEGESINQSQYAVINSGDYGRIIKLTSAPSGALSSTSTIQFQDALTGETIFSGSGLTVGIGGNTSTNIDGQPYYFNVKNYSDSSSVNITWGAGSAADKVGSVTTVFPRIKLKNGGWVAILQQVELNGTLTYSMPGLETLTSYESGLAMPETGNSTLAGGKDNASVLGVEYTKKFGNVNYTMNNTGAGNKTLQVWGIDTNNVEGGVPECNFNSTLGPAILFLEEKKSTESGNSDNGDAICFPADTSGTTTVEISIASPVVTGVWSELQTWGSNDYMQSGVTKYGTFIKYDTTENDIAEVEYPNEQMFIDILFSAGSATITPGSGGSTGAGGQVLIVRDTEVSSVASKNLFVVGGSCINTVAAKILDSTSPICGADFTTKTEVGAGQYIIKTVESPYNADKIATLVAGYEAAETILAVKTAMDGVDTAKGLSQVYPIASTTITE